MVISMMGNHLECGAAQIGLLCKNSHRIDDAMAALKIPGKSSLQVLVISRDPIIRNPAGLIVRAVEDCRYHHMISGVKRMASRKTAGIE
jgi:hypothetical protein